jgi:hypothetical protein
MNDLLFYDIELSVLNKRRPMYQQDRAELSKGLCLLSEKRPDRIMCTKTGEQCCIIDHPRKCYAIQHREELKRK